MCFRSASLKRVAFLSVFVDDDDVFGGLVIEGAVLPLVRGLFGHLPVYGVDSSRECSCGIRGSLGSFVSVRNLTLPGGEVDLEQSRLAAAALAEGLCCID